MGSNPTATANCFRRFRSHRLVDLALPRLGVDEPRSLVDLLLEARELRVGGVELFAVCGEGSGEVASASP